MRFSSSSLLSGLRGLSWQDVNELLRLLRPILRPWWKHRRLFWRVPNKEMAIRSIVSWPYSQLFVEYLERELQARGG
jgi:hypothetical protein